ncbi:MAG TPA: class I tRNA ligase family protein, partial [Candidatus Cloacimonas sp.]|nr:class I tRNA ligase family protein [Candidatus Cloacimonas sp.]
NVVDPKYIIDRYGADTLRTFLLFASPPEKDVDWSDDGIMGAFRFLNRVWRLIDSNLELIKRGLGLNECADVISERIKELRYETHYAIYRWREDCLSRLQFNTAIATCMEFLNAILKIKEPEKLNAAELKIYAFACATLPKLLYPFAPHIAEELWQKIGNENMLNDCGLPEYDERYLIQDKITYVIQVNGKLRGKIEVEPDITAEEIKRMALEAENVKRYIAEQDIKKIIVVPGKMVSIAVGK